MATQETAQSVPGLDSLYFIRAGEFVKIGRTSNLAARLVSIQTGCPFELGAVVCVAEAGRYEKEVHRRLSGQHYRGEWFHWCDTVEQEMQRQQDTPAETKLALTYLDECQRNGPDSPLATSIRAGAYLRQGLAIPELAA